MADVTDVISRFFYPTETKDLEKAYGLLLENVKAVDDNTKSITRLEEVRARTDKANLERLAQLDRAIENRKNRINQEIGLIKGQIAANDNLRKSINSNISFLNNLTKTGTTFVNAQGKMVESTNKAGIALLNFNRVVQDAPFGILGIANNIDPLVLSFQALQKETGSTGGALKSMLAGLIGPSGLAIGVSVVTSLLIAFGDELFSSGEEAKKSSKELSDYDQAINEVASSIGNEIGELQKLVVTASNVNLTYTERGKAVDELQSKYPDYFGNLSREMILNGEVGATYKSLTRDIIARAQATLQYNLIAKEAENIASAQLELEKIRQRDGVFFGSDQAEKDAINQAEGRIKMGEQRIKQAQRNIDAENSLGLAEGYWLDQNEKKQYEKSRNAGKEDALLTEKQREERDKRAKQNEKAGNQAVKEAEREAKRIQKAYEGALLEFKEFSVENVGEFNEALEKDLDDKAKSIGNLLGELRKSFDKGLSESLGASDTASLNGGAGSLNAQLLLDKDIDEAKKKADKKEADRRKKNQESILKSEQSLQDSILRIMQNTADRQVQLLDYEIQVRTQRVQQATLLAQNGNAEILKSEQERLDAAQKKREDIAQRQLQINQLLQASSAAIAAAQALQTVTNAGATGDPYSAAARIAAAVAALAAGFAFVSNLVNTFQGFREGVIDYNGKGNGTSDSNLVRISHGESVMTASETKTYRGALTAMREGNFYNQYLPAQYTYKGNNNSESHDLRREFGMLREAFENSGIKVRTSVTNGQISTIVEKERKVDKRRFGE